MAVFESLVWLGLELQPAQPAADTFAWIERAKARSLADAMAAQSHLLDPPAFVGDETRQRVRTLRTRLHGLQREMFGAEAAGDNPERLIRLRREARDCEGALVEIFQEMPAASDYVALQTGQSVPLDAIQARLPPDTILVEFFETRGTLIAASIGCGSFVIDRLGPVAAVHEAWRLLQFQLSKFQLVAQRPADNAAAGEAVTAHLRRLGDLLIGPIARRLAPASHVIVVPHRMLHSVPFHALHDAEGWVLDRWSMLYAPSASVWHACVARERPSGSGSLVMGVSDAATPAIPHEVRAVAAALPGATLLLGDEATEQALRDLGPACRIIHIATHGRFRRTTRCSPRFVWLAETCPCSTSRGVPLSADLVSLSGCGTGLERRRSAAMSCVGLTRALLSARARAVLVVTVGRARRHGRGADGRCLSADGG